MILLSNYDCVNGIKTIEEDLVMANLNVITMIISAIISLVYIIMIGFFLVCEPSYLERIAKALEKISGIDNKKTDE